MNKAFKLVNSFQNSNKAFKFNEKILQNLLEESKIFLKKINIKASLRKRS